MSSIRFNHANPTNRLFVNTLRKRVDEYFKSRNISKFGNAQMVIKTIFMFALYLTPITLLFCDVFSSLWIQYGLWVLAGLGMAGIGLSVMHDANHGSYSRNGKINQWLSQSITVIGGYFLNWQLQHNNLHHTYTNIHGHDEDIAPPGFLRFSPHAPYKKIHRFQIFYAWFFYSLMTLMWVTTKDFSQLIRFNRMGLLKTAKKNFTGQLIAIILSKLGYYAYMIVLPMLVMEAEWYHILLGFLALQLTAGLMLALIFQPAHVMEDTDFPLPDTSGNMENDWAVHQLHTTANFAPKSRVFSWFVGGLNYQVEHHLFPNICHVHYKQISAIVKETAKEFGYPYHSISTFPGALLSHAKMLNSLGKAA